MRISDAAERPACRRLGLVWLAVAVEERVRQRARGRRLRATVPLPASRVPCGSASKAASRAATKPTRTSMRWSRVRRDRVRTSAARVPSTTARSRPLRPRARARRTVKPAASAAPCRPCVTQARAARARRAAPLADPAPTTPRARQHVHLPGRDRHAAPAVVEARGCVDAVRIRLEARVSRGRTRKVRQGVRSALGVAAPTAKVAKSARQAAAWPGWVSIWVVPGQ